MLFVLLLSLVAGGASWTTGNSDVRPVSVTQADAHKGLSASRPATSSDVDEADPNGPPLTGGLPEIVEPVALNPLTSIGVEPALALATADAASYDARAPPAL